MVDPIVLSAAVGLVVSPAAGRVWLRGLDLAPQHPRRVAEWTPVAYIAFRTWLASAVVSLVPLYFGVDAMTLGRPLHAPESALDRILPLEPAWMLVYASPRRRRIAIARPFGRCALS